MNYYERTFDVLQSLLWFRNGKYGSIYKNLIQI